MNKMSLVEEVIKDSEYDAIMYAEELRHELAGMGYRVIQKGSRVRLLKREKANDPD